MSDDQAAAALRFFNPNDTNPLTHDQINDSAKNLAAEYVVTAEDIQRGGNIVKPFVGGLTPPSIFGIVKNLFNSARGAGSIGFETWSTNIDQFTKQLTSRLGAAARYGPSHVYRTQYEILKSGI